MPKIKCHRSNASTGFTLIEILIVIGIFLIISSIVFFSFSNLNKVQALDKSAMSVASVLEEARSLTLSSKDSSQYGVFFDDDEVVLFKGEDYDPNEIVKTVSLNPLVEISEIFGGDADEVVFERLTGKASEEGLVVVSLKSDSEVQKIIKVYLTGLVEIN